MKKIFAARRHSPLALLLLLSACATDPAHRPSLAPVAEKVAARDFAGTTLDFDLVVNNPTARPMAVQGYTYKFFVVGHEFRTDRVASKANVPAGDPWQSTLSVSLRLGEIDAFLSRKKQQQSSVRYELIGAVHLVDRSGQRKLPFRVQGDIALLRKPEFALENLHVDNLTADGAHITFDVVVRNPNAFALRVGNASVDLILDGQTFSNQKPVIVPLLDPNQSARQTLTVDARFSILGLTARYILDKRKVSYNLVGRATFSTPWGDKRIDFQRGGVAELRPLY